MSYFESNLSVLSRKQPELAELLRATPNNKVKVFPSVSGHPTAAWESGTSLALHSKYDPLKDARQRLKQQHCDGANYFIFLGFGLGYPLDALLEERKDPDDRFFIIESDLAILGAAFEARDLTSMLSLPHLHFAWPVSGPSLAEQWHSFFDPVQAQQSVYLTHLPSLSLNAGLFKAAAEMIQSQTFQIYTDINTLVAKSQDFLNNFVQNFMKAAKAPGVARFSGKFPGVPAIIISAGPSLDKNIHELRGNQDRVLLLSTDTALKPLLAAGIEPHFILTGDPSYTNYLHLKDARPPNSILVAEATAFPEVFAEFKDRTIACTFENSSLPSITDLLADKGKLRAWGSVATMALDFALLLGCNPVIFIGQDLAHTGGRVYCSGIFFDDEWFAGIIDPVLYESKMKSIRAARRTVCTRDIFGNEIETTDKLMSYWNWISKVLRDNPDTTFINATEGGILRDGLQIVSLKEALYRHCGKDLHLRKRVAEMFIAEKESDLDYVCANVSTLTGELTSLRNNVNLGIQLCEEEKAPPDLLKKLELRQRSISGNHQISHLIDCFNQMGNIAFLRSKRSLVKKTLNPALIPEFKRVYLDYFLSVREAFTKISDALSRIDAELNSRPPARR